MSTIEKTEQVLARTCGNRNPATLLEGTQNGAAALGNGLVTPQQVKHRATL